ncbi:YaaC family protein [Actinosynnema sp. CS-041913]|uniref:YaaC family protein n=1 Tax=Actinosynnema sp. CS-041913 TaxID=3239917 RepID=UPI003D8EEA8B
MYFTTQKNYWQYLRRMRSAPPSSTRGSDARRGTFSAALEQAEQLYVAASRVDMESKPILLYYGIYQAGRAIAAVNPDAAAPWQLQGHGLKAPGLSERDRTERVLRANLLDGVIRGTGRAHEAFPNIAKILNSPDLTCEVQLGDLVALLDESRTRTKTQEGVFFTPLKDKPAPLGVSIETVSAANGLDIVSLYGFPQSILKAANFTNEVSNYLRLYFPQFSEDWTVHGVNGHNSIGRRGWVSVTRRVVHEVSADLFKSYDPEVAQLEKELRVRRPYYSFDSITEPTLPDQGKSVHRLCLWWAILFQLSMVARYAPNAWTDDLNVDLSALAVGLEQLLELSLEEVPRIVVEVVEGIEGEVE